MEHPESGVGSPSPSYDDFESPLLLELLLPFEPPLELLLLGPLSAPASALLGAGFALTRPSIHMRVQSLNRALVSRSCFRTASARAAVIVPSARCRSISDSFALTNSA